MTELLSHPELDWPGVLRLAGRFAVTERGRHAVLATQPSPDLPEVERRLGLTRDLLTRRGLRSAIAVDGLDEAAPLLSRLGPHGRALAPEDLLDLFALVERSEGARRAVPVEGLELPVLTPVLASLADLEDLLSDKAVTFEADGKIKDTASARLAAIRGSIVRLRQEIVRRLDELVRTRAESLTDTYVTEKRGRYCLPVRIDRRDGVAGIVHEKSGSGQTLFVEPMAVVESNNALAEAIEEEREEIHRILVALTSRFAARREDLERALTALTEVDAFQARAELASITRGVFPAFGEQIILRGARHPLLDRRLAALRSEVFDEDTARHVDAVPLELSLTDRKTLLLSGPNAGGKSVAMKTVGLFSLLAQSGFALPADPGTTLPIFDKVLVVAGDAQDLLGDLSSFAAAMARTAHVMAEAGPRSLVLLDELGSGTDPDEGAAIAIAVLDEDQRRGGFTVATTHLGAVKEWAHRQPGLLSAAMEFDETLGKPTFRVRPGATGRSRALAVAERAGLPARVLESARGRLGASWAAMDAALERLDKETRDAEARTAAAEEAERKAAARLVALEREQATVAAEKARLRDKARLDLDRALDALREKTRRELEKMREDLRTGKSISRSALTTITQKAREEAAQFLEEPEPVASGPVAVGDLVRVQPFKTTGRLLSLDKGRGEAEVEVGGKRMRVAASSLAPISGPEKRAARRSSEAPTASPLSVSEIVLVGRRVDDALPEVERAINDALMAGKGRLRVVHGFGTGRLAAAVKEFLSEHPGVASHRPGDATEGGAAVTMVSLDV